jgi:hypothetical protein
LDLDDSTVAVNLLDHHGVDTLGDEHNETDFKKFA